MVLDPRKRQKKVERKKAKDKSRHKAVALRRAEAAVHRFDRAAEGRIIDSVVSGPLWDEGMANLLLTREVGPDRVALAVFMVDVYCLGVKDATFDIVSRGEYRMLRDKLAGEAGLEPYPPEYIRKLVEDAVEYARSIGFEPHADYQQAKMIFGDIDASACREEFQFGRKGKPFFISGPHDSPAKCARIVRTLLDHCGQGNFDYLIRLSEADMLAAGLSKFVLPQPEDGEDVDQDQLE